MIGAGSSWRLILCAEEAGAEKEGLFKRKAHRPGLWLVAAEDLVGSEEVQLAVALLKHIHAGQPPGCCNQGLLHAGRIHQLPSLDCAGGKYHIRSFSLSNKMKTRLSLPCSCAVM